MAQAARPWMVQEMGAWGELAQLMASPVFYAPPRIGDGRPVVVLPGLFGNDWYLQPLHSWLNRAGFRAVPSGFFVNAGCPDRLTDQVQRDLNRRLSREDGPVAIIGHSRGGMLGRALAARLQKRASHLVLLGSPVGAISGAAGRVGSFRPPSVAEASDRARRMLDPDCDVPFCGCPFPADMTRPLSAQTSTVSIYSMDDPIVPPWSCPVPGARNIEVRGSHIGLAHNQAVYKELLTALQP